MASAREAAPAVRSSMRPARTSTLGATPPRNTDPSADTSRTRSGSVDVGAHSAPDGPPSTASARPPVPRPEPVDHLDHEPALGPVAPGRQERGGVERAGPDQVAPARDPARARILQEPRQCRVGLRGEGSDRRDEVDAAEVAPQRGVGRGVGRHRLVDQKPVHPVGRRRIGLEGVEGEAVGSPVVLVHDREAVPVAVPGLEPPAVPPGLGTGHRAGPGAPDPLERLGGGRLCPGRLNEPQRPVGSSSRKRTRFRSRSSPSHRVRSRSRSGGRCRPPTPSGGLRARRSARPRRGARDIIQRSRPWRRWVAAPRSS